ncbi:hypothetical protein V2J09_020594 [Rumex salicifolius]
MDSCSPGRGSVATGDDHNSPGYVDSESDDCSLTGSVSLSQGGSTHVVLLFVSDHCIRKRKCQC